MPNHPQKQKSLNVKESTVFIHLPCILCVTIKPTFQDGGFAENREQLSGVSHFR